MKLAIFDVDGTLTKTDDIDTVCFLQAFADVHAVTDINTDWNDYPHVSDSAITRELLTRRFGRAPADAEVASVKQHFINLLKRHCEDSPALFPEIPDAASMLLRLRNEGDWAIALATGCWRESARLKLEMAGIRMDDYPAASAEDGFARQDILRAATAKALAHHRQDAFEKVVSVGDGLWDLHTARTLNLAFIGIADDAQAALLRSAGATCVIPDYTDYADFLHRLNSITPLT
jgi:phosphoglycolate phosphatase-like HAD superfamily hydrolase